VDGVPHTSRIGTYRPFDGCAFPVYLTIPAEPAELLHTVDVISGRTGTPFIVMAPTVRRLQPACERVLQTRRSCFLALAESITRDSTGQWDATPAATQQLAAFQQGLIPTATEADARVDDSSRVKQVTPPTPGGQGYPPSVLATKLGLRTTATVNKYAKKLGITTPRTGERDYIYPLADVVKLCRHLTTAGSDQTIRSKAEQLLEMLAKIAR
jgi:hypothetical protein